MKKNFNEHLAELPKLLMNLHDAPLISFPYSEAPTKGIYVFYKKGKPQYVGRTNRMKDRLQEHGRNSSNHNSAQFAFLLARKQASGKGIEIRNIPRKELEKEPEFKKLFIAAKDEVRHMEVRCVEIKDPVTQALFEIYAHLELATHEYNDFDNH
ncbi:MAG TPA: GIY-YIG nuclease family protein [bacterium]|nr:GIY-YIG nuclease family protein [bacterium]